MPKYLIERQMPGAGNLSPEELQDVAKKSCAVLAGEVGNGYHWLHSYVVDDKIYCVHIAPNEEAVREHASRGNFPINDVMEVSSVIDPTTSEA